MNEPTLAEIVTNLREEADGCERLHRAICTEHCPISPPSVITTLRAAADRLEGLAKWVKEVDRNDELPGVWFDERERLLK